MANLPVAVQMFTLRDEAGADFAGTIRKVAEMGYDGVEFAGYGGLSAAEAKKLLDDCGLKPAGAHEGIERFEDSFEETVEFHKELGNKYVAIPFLGPDRWDKPGGWKELAAQMTEIGHKLREVGMQLCYHNHSFEFQKQDGQYGLDILYTNSDPQALMAELDTYWVQHGGEDPVAYIKKMHGRLPLLHLKDMAPGDDKAFAEVGEGILDIQGIVAAAKESGTKWIIVEQDSCPGPAIDSVKKSIDNLKKMGLAG